MLIYKRVGTSGLLGHHTALGTDPELVGQDSWGSQGQEPSPSVNRSGVGAGLWQHVNFSGVGGQGTDMAGNLSAKTMQIGPIQHTSRCLKSAPVSSMRGPEQTALKGSYLDPPLSYANVPFPHLSPGHCSFTKKPNTQPPNEVIERKKVKFPLTRPLLPFSSR